MPKLKSETLKGLFLYSTKEFANEQATSFVDEEPFTYGQIERYSKALANSLLKLGVKKGDRVAILSENSPRWGAAYFANCLVGAVNVPILPDFHGSEINHIIKNSGSKVLFISSKLVHKIEDGEFAEMEYVIPIDDVKEGLDKFKVRLYSDLVREGEDKLKTPVEERVEIKENDLAEILYTSGTTGHSKGVMLTNKNIVANALSATELIQITKEDRLLSILPLSHSYECTCGFIAPFLMGAKTYYIKGLPTAQTLLPAVEVVKPTIILSVPLIMDKIYKKRVVGHINSKFVTRMLYKSAPTRKLLNRIAGQKLYKTFGGNLRIMVFGGAATPAEVEIFLTEGGFPYITGYGLTEAAPLLTANPVGKQRIQSAGVVVPRVMLRIDDPDPNTGIGEIVAKGPNIMQGYYLNEEATRKTFTEDGWLITGDRGYIDEDGYLFIKGRSKNIIVGPSGENIFPEEIEFHLSQNPYILEALVYEKDDKIMARVFLDYETIDQELGKHGVDESKASREIQKLLEEIRKEVNTKISSYSRIHKIIEQPEEFVKTPTKKIKRYLYTE
jgi:long-chain acyl-CoA synthetase